MLNLKISQQKKNTRKSGTLWTKTNIRIIGIEKREEDQLKDSGNVFNNIIEENSPNTKAEMPIKVQEACWIPYNILDKKRKSSWHIIFQTLNIESKAKDIKNGKGKWSNNI